MEKLIAYKIGWWVGFNYGRSYKRPGNQMERDKRIKEIKRQRSYFQRKLNSMMKSGESLTSLFKSHGVGKINQTGE